MANPLLLQAILASLGGSGVNSNDMINPQFAQSSPQQSSNVPIPESIPVRPQGTPSMAGNFAQQKADQSAQRQKFNSSLGQILLQMGVPIGAAIAGSINPDLLPQAAGLATGYNQGMESVKKAKKEIDEENALEDLVLVDGQTGNEIKRIKVKKKDRVEVIKKGNNFFGDFHLDEDGKLTFPEEKESAVKSAQQQTKEVEKGRIRVKVKSSGETGTIDADEFDSSIYEKVQ